MRIKIKDKNNFVKTFNQIYPENKIQNINGISIDSRTIENHDIFIPFKGNSFDGHKFIDNVLKKNGTICLSENKAIIHKRVIYTPSNKKALFGLASLWRKKMKAQVIAITGSNGKTTTKELLYHIIKDKYKCSKSIGNHNSTIGLPLSLFDCKIDDEYTVLELGANQPGEIKTLCNFIQPDLGLITNISNAHIGNFKSLEDISKTKSAVFTSLSISGIAFINLNDKAISKIPVKSNQVTFGINNNNADYNGILKNNLKMEINNFMLDIPEEIYHLNEAIVAVYAISKTLKMNDDIFQKAINSFSIPNGRGEIKKINGLKIIDDTYNANPASMKFGITRLSKIKSKNRKILIIGDMLELGKYKIDEHIQIGKLINSADIDIVLTFGDIVEYTFKELNSNFLYKQHFSDMQLLKKKLKTIIEKNDLIYIKGSRSMQLERIYN